MKTSARVRAKNRKHYYRHREKCIASVKRYYQENKERLCAYQRQHKRKLKEEVLLHYGNGKLACANCGFRDIRALTIDHIRNNGAEERQRLGNMLGSRFYYWLRRSNYPQGYQVLCMNCQFIKRWMPTESIERQYDSINKRYLVSQPLDETCSTTTQNT